MIAKTTLIILLGITLASCSSAQKKLNQSFVAKSKTAREFVTALLSSDVERAKLLSASEQWAEIDEWVKAYQPISCTAEETDTPRESFIPPELSGGSWFTSEMYDEQSNKWLVDVSYDCQGKNSHYCFEMNGTRLEKINDEWRIMGWNKICENRNESDPCPSMCQ